MSDPDGLSRDELLAALAERDAARILLGQIDALTRQIDQLAGRITTLLAAIPAAGAPEPASSNPTRSGTAGTGPGLPAVARLAEIPGLSPGTVHQILAETGLDMTRFPTAGHLVSWARLCPRTIQSGTKTATGASGKGNPYLKGVLGLAASVAARSPTFLGERYRRPVKRRGKLKTLVAVARSILVIIWHLLADPTARYRDLGAGYHTNRTNPDRKIRSLVQQLQALGHHVTLQPAA